ncbi:MAG: undecaprenyl-diphosphate phosphatase [Gemmatimonadota bacterium]
MNLFQAIFLGLVQGLTEFLPVSSSGHLVLTEALLGLRTPGVTFEVAVHLATVLAVLWVYRTRVGRLAAGMLRGDRSSLRYVGLLILASVPAGLAGILGKDFFEYQFGQPVTVAILLLVTGALVYSVHLTRRSAHDEEPSSAQALLIGVAQAFAILPGISRSGATVAMGSWRGVEVVKLAEFSFLLSVPAVIGAAVLQLGELGRGAAGGITPAVLGAAFVAALVSGIFAIRLFVRMLRHKHFSRFAYYCWAAGGAYLVAAAFLPALR